MWKTLNLRMKILIMLLIPMVFILGGISGSIETAILNVDQGASVVHSTGAEFEKICK